MAAEPVEVRRRLRAGLLPIRSLWFSTLAELRTWDRSTVPLFVRFFAEDRLEVGPRLVNVSAARFCPVLDVQLVRDGDHTRLVGRRRYPAFATGLLTVWGILLALWLGIALPAVLRGETSGGWLFWWALMVAVLVACVGLGWRLGGRALDEGLEVLGLVVTSAASGEDDWG